MKLRNEVKSADVSIKLRRRAGARSGTSADAASGASEALTLIESSIDHQPTTTPTLTSERNSYREVSEEVPARGGARGAVRAAARSVDHVQFHSTVRAESSATVQKASTLDQALELAEKLSRGDSQRLLDQLALRSKLTDKQTYNRDLDAWVSCVHAELNARLSTDESYGLMLVKKQLGTNECWLPIERFMKASSFNERSSAERRSLYMLLAEIVVDHSKHEARKYGSGLKLSDVMRACPDVFSIFDYHFPGYLVNGLAYVVADQRRKLTDGA